MRIPRLVSSANALARLILACLLVVSTAAFATGQSEGQEEPAKRQIDVEWIYSDAGRAVAAIPSFVWLRDGSALLYDRRQPEAERTIVSYSPGDGRRAARVDAAKALWSLKSLLSEEEAPQSLDWPIEIDQNGRWALYTFDGDLFVLDMKTSEFRRLTRTPPEEISARFSPDGERVAFVRENDLYVAAVADGSEKRLTFDGAATLLNGTLSWVYWEELFGRRDLGYWWSEDSSSIAFLQTDETLVGEVQFVDFSPNTPRVVRQRYPKSGTANPRVRVGVVTVADAKTTWVDLGAYPHEYVARVKWLRGSDRLSVQTLDRQQKKLDLFFVDLASGAATHILRETDPGWVNVHDDLYFLETANEFLWQSERDGYAHLYRYRIDGEFLNQVTRGKWALRSSGGPFWLRSTLVSIDEEAGSVYFTALEKSSIERHLYRVQLDGSGLTRLSEKDGAHRVSFSPDGSYYFDAYSNVSTLPSLSLHGRTGRRLHTLAAPRPELLEPFDMQYPEFLDIPAADGFSMPAQVLKPADFDPEKKYPVIFYVYGGPSAPTVSNSWQRGIYFDQILARRGYLVVRVDNRSATARSKELENTVLLRGWGSGELADLIDAVKWFKARPYADPSRVGIWGWSGGGTFTLRALTGSKEFKAGIAVAGVTSWDYYDTIYTESFMKRRRDNPEGYEETSLIDKAKNLHGRLLIVHGTHDDNVHIQNTWSFVDELVKAGILFDMMIYPTRKHGISDDPARVHLFETMLEFWDTNL